MVGLGRRAEQLGEDWLQAIGPNLIALGGRMQPVLRIQYSFDKVAAGIGQFIVDVQIPHFFAIGKFRDIVVNFVDGGNHGGWGARKNPGQDDGGVGRLLLANVEYGLDTFCDVLDLGIAPRTAADVIDSRQDDDDLWVDPVEFAVIETPEDILNQVGAPTKVRGIPAVEIGCPVFQICLVLRIAGAPPTGDGITLEVDVDAAFFGLFEQLRVGEFGIVVGARSRYGC